MKQQIAIGIIATALVGGTGTGLAVRELRASDTSTSTSSTTTSTPAPKPTAEASTATPAKDDPSPETAATKQPSAPALLPVSSMRIATGAVGPVSVGMTKSQALATGYFEGDVASQNCEVTVPLQWRTSYAGTLDVFTNQSGSITSIGIRAGGPRTRSGLQVGSTYAQVRAVVGAEAAKPVATGYGQSGVFVNDGNAWIGFLFDTKPDQLGNGDSATFIEVTRGRKPSLMRDGC